MSSVEEHTLLQAFLMQNFCSRFFPLVSLQKELLFVSTVQYNDYGYNAYV